MTQCPQLHLGKTSDPPLASKVLQKLKPHMIQAAQLICSHEGEKHTEKERWNNSGERLS